MKKLLFLGVVILLFSNFVLAGMGRTLEIDFNEHREQVLLLYKSDRVLFSYGGYNHTIIVDEVKDDVAEIDLFLFLEKGLHTPNYLFLDKKSDVRIDFDKDNRKDLNIKLLDASTKTNTTKIQFTVLGEWDPNNEIRVLQWDVAPSTKKDYYFNRFNKPVSYVIITFILLGGLLLIIRKRKENSDLYY